MVINLGGKLALHITREAGMKYRITYRLTHTQSLPATSVTEVDACNHADLMASLVRLKAKWQARGYAVQVVRVIPWRHEQVRSRPKKGGRAPGS